MIKFTRVSIFILSIIFSIASNAYITTGKILNFADGRQLILFGDKYTGVSKQWNQESAPVVAQAIKNFALKFPSSTINVSFQDPGVYNAGHQLKDAFPTLASQCQEFAKNNQFPALFPLMVAADPMDIIKNALNYPSRPLKRAELTFHILPLERPAKLSTLLLGDLVMALAQMPTNEWPKNLKLRSNDPRVALRAAYIKSPEWQEVHSPFVSMKNLVLLPKRLKAKMKFPLDSELDESVREKFEAFKQEFIDEEKLYLEAFINFASSQCQNEITLEDLNKPLAQLHDRIPLSVLKDFFAQELKDGKMYANAVVLDVLLSLFTTKPADKVIAIVGQKMMEKIGYKLTEFMLPIDSEITIANVQEFLYGLAQSPDFLDTQRIIF